MTVSADTTQLAAAPEDIANPGVIVAPPVFDLLRLTGEGLNFAPNTQLSNELNPSRQVQDSILTGAEARGDLNFELAKSPGFENLLSAAFGADWAGNTLKVGNLLKTHSLEKRFLTDPVAPAYAFHRYPGCAMNTVTLNIVPNQPITGTFGVIGQTLELGTAELAGATYTPAGVLPVMTAPNVDNIVLFGAAVQDCISNLVVTITNNVSGLECIGTLGFDSLSAKRFEATTRMTIYFSDNTLMQHMIDQSEGDLIFRCVDALGNFYNWLLPRMKISGSEVVAGGTNQDVVYNLTFAALYDDTDLTSVQVDRG